MVRSYGFADVEAEIPAERTNSFRIASMSKTVTAVAIMRLVEDGHLGLDDPALASLPDLQPPEGATPDPRLADITIRNLLQHTGGWARGR